jgi:hypothetical protein
MQPVGHGRGTIAGSKKSKNDGKEGKNFSYQSPYQTVKDGSTNEYEKNDI